MDELNDYITRELPIEDIIKFDYSIQNLFEEEFYNISSNPLHIEDGNSIYGLLSCFIRSWKNLKERSYLLRTLPTLLSGSIVEGASLSRLFHPNLSEGLEMEADMMYVAGNIDKKTANECFEFLSNAPGYFRLKYSDQLVDLENETLDFKDMTVSRDGVKYITGTMLKLIHKEVQPSNKQLYRRFDINKYIYEVSITRSESGPSSEIIFQNELVTDKTKIEKVLIFLHKAAEKIDEYLKKYEDSSLCFTERLEIARELAYAVEDEWKKNRQNINDDIKYMFSELVLLIEAYVSRYKVFMEDSKQITKFIESLRRMTHIDVNKYPEKSYTSTLEIEKYLKSSRRAYNEFHQYDYDDAKTENFQTMFNVVKSLAIGHLHVTKKTALDPFLDSIKDNILSFQKGLNLTIEQIKANNQSSLKSRSHVISFDNVPCLYCPFWPDSAKEWRTRNRQWPKKSSIDKIVSTGCHIVSKSMANQNDDLAWRWSFSISELKIAKLRTKAMRYCYFIFKSLFYKHFKFKIDGKSLPSYVAKTCMLYVSERHPYTWWVEDGNNDSSPRISYCVLQLFIFLVKSLENGILPHYFLQTVNLFSEIPDKILKKALKTCQNILDNPSAFIVFNALTINSIVGLLQEISIFDVKSQKRDFASANIKKLHQVVNAQGKLHMNIVKKVRTEFCYHYYTILLIANYQHSLITLMELKLGLFPLPDEKRMQLTTEISNRKVELENKRKLQMSLRETGTKALQEMNCILGIFCLQCDLCFEKIPCGTRHFNCAECDYDECLKCKQVGDSTKHEHNLVTTSSCSPYCISQPKEELLQEKITKELPQKYLKEYEELNKEFEGLIISSGMTLKVDAIDEFDTSGIIMEQLLSEIDDQDMKDTWSENEIGSSGKGISITLDAKLSGKTFDESHLEDFNRRLKESVQLIKQGKSEIRHLEWAFSEIFNILSLEAI